MRRLSRRTFLQGAVASAAAPAIGGTKSSGKVLGANDTIRLAVAGLNGRGGEHVKSFGGMKGVEIVALIDPDTRTYKKRIAELAKLGGKEPRVEKDVRKVLEDKSVNAVSIATPNHWHALMTVWSCQAGKDVYVEKPCSHNIHEGRIAVEAARKNKCVVQHGTQNRSSQSWADLAALAKSGKLGKLLVSRGLCYKTGDVFGTRGDIGTKATKVPPGELDFNIWLGPAAEQAYHENLVHYRWHWFWDFGNGDAGNQGVHQMDVARWLIPGGVWPKSVLSVGGRYANGDQGQTPNALVTVFDYGETQLVFETRGLKSAKFHGQDVGNVLHFEEGVVAGGQFYPKGKDKGEPVPKVGGAVKVNGGGPFGNFIDCVRSRDTAKLNADIEVGHVSSGLCHLGNISYRLGKDTAFDPKSGAVSGNETATESLGRMAEHLKDSGVKFDGSNLRVGRTLAFDGATEKFTGDAEANKLLTRAYRAPFVVPEKA